MVKLIVLYGQPADPAAFEQYYRDIHMPIAAQIKGVTIELAKVVGAPDGSRSSFFWLAEATFESTEHMQRVLATPEAQRTVADIANFATGGVTMLVAEVQ
jgi:uncharacterized protein (TIGR02118 family)